MIVPTFRQRMKEMVYPAMIASILVVSTTILMPCLQASIRNNRVFLLGTIIGRIASDVLNPVMDLMFYSEMEAGRIPPMPQIVLDSGLMSANIEIDYQGPLAIAQKRAHSTQGIRAGLAFIGEVAQIEPNAVRMVDWHGMITKGLMDLNFPAKFIISQARYQAEVDAANKQASDAAGMEQLSQVGDMLPKMGKAVEPNSPAEMLLNMAGGKLKAEGE